MRCVNGKRFLFAVLFMLLCADMASAKRLTIAVSNVNVRSGPGTNYDIKYKWETARFYPVVTIKQSGNWYKVKDFEGDAGWIREDLLSNMPSVIIKNVKESANIRSGPGADYEIIFYAEKGVPFKVLQHKGSWIQVQHADGEKGWVHKSLVW